MQNKLIGLAVLPLVSLLAPLAGANEASWLELDKDIASLSTTAVVAGEGMAVSGFLKSYYMSDSDTNTGEWGFDSVRVNLKANFEDIAVKISWDMKDNQLALKDAHASWKTKDGMTVTFGKFKRPFLHSFAISKSKRLFIASTANASNEERDNGVKLSGDISDTGTWQIAVTNGYIDPANEDLYRGRDEMYYTARAAFTLMGDGGFNSLEGGRGNTEGTNASFGISFAEENGTDIEGHKLGIELAANKDAFYFHLDIVEYDDNFTSPLTGMDSTLGTALKDTNPMGITASYMLADDMEIALRREEFNDNDDSVRLSVAFNYYSILPNKMMWQINCSDVSSDDPALEGELIQVGLTLTF